MASFKTLSTLVAPCSSIKIPSFDLCSWPLLDLCTWTPENSSMAPKGDEGPFEKPLLRNKSCKRLISRPQRSIKPCYTNRSNSRIFTMPLTKDLYIEERAQWIEVNDDEHSLFMALRLGYCYYNVWKKMPECFFRLHEASEVPSFSPGLSFVSFCG